MIVLDTNVLSELLRPEPNPLVREWLNRQVAETLYLSSVTVAELLFGVAELPEGRRRAVLEQAVQQSVALFGERILPFDTAAARCHAALAVLARRRGRAFPRQMVTLLPLRPYAISPWSPGMWRRLCRQG